VLSYNRRTHTLEYRGHDYRLREPERPQLFREQLPFSEVPKLSWNHRLTPASVPADIWIVDSTFVSGRGGGLRLDPGAAVRLLEHLVRLGGQNGVIRQLELPLGSAADREILERCLERDYRYPMITAFVDGPLFAAGPAAGTALDEESGAPGFATIKSLGLREVGFRVPASDYQIALRHGKSRREVQAATVRRVRAALEEGLVPRCHLQDITRADIFGFVIPLVKELLALAEAYRSKVKLRLCDTLGLGVPFNGTSLPRSVPALVNALTHYAGVPGEWLEWVGGNDFHKALVNAATAWVYGCAAVVGSAGGLGVRTGVAPLEALVFEYAQLRGTLNGADPATTGALAALLEEVRGAPLPAATPFAGSAATEVEAGGADAALLERHPAVFFGFDPERLLGRSLRLLGSPAPSQPPPPSPPAPPPDAGS